MSSPQIFLFNRRRTSIVNIGDTVAPRPLSSRRRTGRVFHVDTFENYYDVITEKWVQSSGTIALNTDYPKDGSVCMKLTTGSAQNDVSVATLYLGSFHKGRFGIEFDLMFLEDMGNISYFTIRINYWDGEYHHIAEIRWLGQATLIKFQYGVTSTTYGDIDDGDYNVYSSTSIPVYHNMKLIADFTLEEFVRFIFNNKEYDLSGISYRKEVNTDVEGYMSVHIEIMNFVSTASRSLYIDNVIFTDQEP